MKAITAIRKELKQKYPNTIFKLTSRNERITINYSKEFKQANELNLLVDKYSYLNELNNLPQVKYVICQQGL